MIRAAAPATLYVCGGAANELELADRFTHVLLLEIDEPAMLARLDARQPLDQVADAILFHTLASSAASRDSKRSSQPGSPARGPG
jgi:hypothetical protein